MDNKFFVRSRHGDFCSSVSFHNKNGAGYGTDLNNLELFTLEDAQKQLDWNVDSLPLLASEVMKLAVDRVDMQYLDDVKGQPENDDDVCVVQIIGPYDGNDIKFKDEAFGTYNLKDAVAITFGASKGLDKSSHKVWLQSYLETISRPTFQSENINLRTMVRGAGIKYKKPRKLKPTTGKTRGNCPVCGKITWDFNPYENALCGKWGCELEQSKRISRGY